jgi:hypothetical protein
MQRSAGGSEQLVQLGETFDDHPAWPTVMVMPFPSQTVCAFPAGV